MSVIWLQLLTEDIEVLKTGNVIVDVNPSPCKETQVYLKIWSYIVSIINIKYNI